ncbi:hypothetical protein RGQ29_019951 [Quercus rubra]|uniref:NADH dehydrogenase subunit 5 n=1 Tax=Quercus rubra TaxID=3512 RepID=A0AAN7FCD5_QUERU|nr:hypothetical protein RGQ29_019951 [Quercus rubra]
MHIVFIFSLSMVLLIILACPIVNVDYHSFLTEHKYVCRYVILPSAVLLVLGAWISFGDWVIRKFKIM